MSKTLSDEAFLEMRWRCLSLAADLDRVDRGEVVDGRLTTLRNAIEILLLDQPNRAERIQLLFSDK